MRIVLFIIMAMLTFSSCQYDYKRCEYITVNEKENIYNDILTELVEHHFYNSYLGKDKEMLFNKYTSGDSDTAKMRKEVIQLQNNLFNDTARFCILYLDTIHRDDFNPWAFYQDSTKQYRKLIKDLITSFSTDGQAVIDSLNSMQLDVEANDFHLCTSKVLSLRDAKSQEGKCALGIVSLSKVFFNKGKTKGLLYCNYHCGELCGKGELLVIEKTNNHWTITETIYTWFS